MNKLGCMHLMNFKATEGTKSYRVICSYFISCTSAEARRRKAFSCYCYTCKCVDSRLHSCLQCIFFGCFDSGHIQEHSKINKHFLAVDLTHGMVMCFQCGDYVHDGEFIDIFHELNAKAATNLGLPVPYQPWMPTYIDIELLRLHPRRRRIEENNTVGLRGLVTSGSTCFMNSIVQALTHTPLLRDYFLAERHQCRFQNNPELCLVCEVSRLFQEFYSGNETPLILDRLLYMIWMHAHYLAGYVQQDAHEFFIATLNVLHCHCKESSPVDSSNPHQCKCIIDQIFTGSLQSDVVCQACRSVSTTINPFWDISLDLAIENPASQSSESGQKRNEQNPISLIDCLAWFTRPEHLGNNVKIKCNNCQSDQECTRQLTMKKLPIIACFHLKRFEHSNLFHNKISTYIEFPEVLDMTPFLSRCRNSGIDMNSMSGLHDNRYSLFAVINHHGSSEYGHYTAYIRQLQNHWFKCNGHIISRANIQEVLNSEGYLLFYHKKYLEYE